MESQHDRYFGKSQERYDVLILRDPFNLMASRLKSDFMTVKAPHKTVLDLWLEYDQEFCGETNFLKTHPCVFVNYNRWTQERDYRQSLAENLGIPFTDAGLDRVSHHGGGSSFAGTQVDGETLRRHILDRWQQYRDDPSYCKLLGDARLHHYSAKIFGTIPGVEGFLTP